LRYPFVIAPYGTAYGFVFMAEKSIVRETLGKFEERNCNNLKTIIEAVIGQ